MIGSIILFILFTTLKKCQSLRFQEVKLLDISVMDYCTPQYHILFPQNHISRDRLQIISKMQNVILSRDFKHKWGK